MGVMESRKPLPGAQERAELVAGIAELDRMAKALTRQALSVRLNDKDPLCLMLLAIQNNIDVALVVVTGFVENERQAAGAALARKEKLDAPKRRTERVSRNRLPDHAFDQRRFAVKKSQR
jgi:hypothetical protein